MIVCYVMSTNCASAVHVHVYTVQGSSACFLGKWLTALEACLPNMYMYGTPWFAIVHVEYAKGGKMGRDW